MGDQVGLADAERALTEIGRRREQVIRRATVPDWYWSAMGALMVALTAGVESRRGVLLGIGVAVFVLGMLGTTGWVVLRLIRGAQPRRNLIDDLRSVVRMVVGIMSFTAIIIGVALPVGFSLKAAKMSYAGTITVAITAVLLAIGGPILMRYLTRVMLASRIGRHE